jgi:hypothetical protein
VRNADVSSGTEVPRSFPGEISWIPVLANVRFLSPRSNERNAPASPQTWGSREGKLRHWELRFRQSRFHRLPRVLREKSFHVFGFFPLSEDALVPSGFRLQGSPVTQGSPYASFPPVVGISHSSNATHIAASNDIARPPAHAAANASSPSVARAADTLRS